MKTTGDLLARARQAAKTLWVWALVFVAAFLASAYFYTDVMVKPALALVALMAVIAVVVAYLFLKREQDGRAFVLTALVVVLVIAMQFLILYPRLMVSSLGSANDLTIMNAASGQNTLNVMSIVAAIFVPLVLLYQGWTYWVFRKRLTEKPENLTY
jgi:cytochrome d ubiquinol oxidase subunit II